MDNSIFLKGKSKGINKELRGNVAFCYILVDEQAGRWSAADENAVVNSILPDLILADAGSGQEKCDIEYPEFCISQ